MTKHTLQQSHGPAYTRIYAIGAARGANLVPNDGNGKADVSCRRSSARGRGSGDRNAAHAVRPRASCAGEIS